jgi:hypothetical protein
MGHGRSTQKSKGYVGEDGGMKRFTATEKWDKEWFMDLSVKHKVLWQFLCDSCDAAGVWEPNWRLASVQIGEKVKTDDLKVFGERVEVLPDGKVLMRGFVSFQYGQLSRDCRPHQNILRIIERRGIQALVEGHPDYINRVAGTPADLTPKGIHTLKEEEEEKEEEQDKELETEQETRARDEAAARVTEDEIYDAYPLKVGKPNALLKIRAALRVPSEGVPPDAWPATLLATTKRYAAARKGADTGYTPHPATWFNQRRFDDDPATWLTANGNHAPASHAPDPNDELGF